MVDAGLPWYVAVVLTLILGGIVGAVQGGAVAYLNILLHRDACRHAGLPRAHPLRARRPQCRPLPGPASGPSTGFFPEPLDKFQDPFMGVDKMLARPRW